ncbi:MAG: hypothetical protein MJE68_33145, partial [Proteobacteria bacterium]|nr:hypothetical protein [Pseudomonadota bacterium]
MRLMSILSLSLSLSLPPSLHRLWCSYQEASRSTPRATALGQLTHTTNSKQGIAADTNTARAQHNKLFLTEYVGFFC